ncbi:MAG TPA: carboxypeptidase-like regulatory domain-containing protein [Chloroflexia bacterium]|nr:carboxypeptidase-like regulatory domain-containing protein [Chloroflexia bacterium]
MDSIAYGTRQRLNLPRLLIVLGIGCLAVAGWGGTPRAQAADSATILSGYVFNYAGAFVPGATITVYSMPAHVAVGASSTTDAEGQFSLDTGTGTFAVRATAPGYDFSEQTVYAYSYQTGLTFILRQTEAKLPRPLVATVSGRVTSLDAVPLGGMTIVATTARDTGVRQVTPPPALNVTVTAADGTYNLQVPEGEVWLTLKTGAAWGYQREPLEVTPGQDMPNSDFVAAIRVLPRTEIPEATATPAPSSNVGPIVGMPSTGGAGQPAATLWLGALGVLLLIMGSMLGAAARQRR